MENNVNRQADNERQKGMPGVSLEEIRARLDDGHFMGLGWPSSVVRELLDRAESTSPEVTEMRLCEILFVTPRPGQLYRFTVAEDCEDCKRLAAPYAQERA